VPDDEAAARAWLAAAERSGDDAALARALAHLARSGDAESYDRLARRNPWPRALGHGDTRRLRGADRSALFRGAAADDGPVRSRLGVGADALVSVEFDRAL